MTRLKITAILLSVLLFGACNNCQSSRETAFQKANRCNKATVMVFSPLSVGSGSHIGNGVILTASHVLPEDIYITAELPIRIATDNQLIFNAEVLYRDEEKDLALLKVDGLILPKIEIASTEPVLEEKVYAIGHQFGIYTVKTFQVGYVIGSGDKGIDGTAYILHSAALNPGCSGGPTLNKNYKVFSVNRSIINPYVDSFAGISRSGTLSDLQEFLKDAKEAGADNGQ